MLSSLIRRFMQTEAKGGLLLMFAAALAMLCANGPWQEYYAAAFSHTVLFWINDGLMVLFFLLIGMEVKRELLVGELSEPSQALLPAVAAFGGMLCPALIYIGFNHPGGGASHGWAIASATDIAFSLCVLSLCGRHIPPSLKIFLTAIAVIDDLGAILIIALFYTDTLALAWLALAMAALAALWWAGRRGRLSFALYGALGLVLWFAVLRSGVHATIAGVLLGLMIPLKKQPHHATSMLTRLELQLHPWVSYVVLPVFAFANAGISLADISFASLAHPVSLGVIAGLFAGKQLGIFAFTAIPVMLGFAKKPEGAGWMQLYGVALLAGIGFTMSLFIGGLAFGEGGHFTEAKLGILAGSLLSAVVGFGVLRVARAK